MTIVAAVIPIALVVMFDVASSYPEAGDTALTLALSEPASHDVQVTYEIAAGTATAFEDLGTGVGHATILAGELGTTFNVILVEDDIHEGPETFTVTLVSADGATIQPEGKVVTIEIEDDDPVPSATVADVVVGEGDGEALVTITLSNPSADFTGYLMRTLDGSASHEAGDYVATEGGTVGISAGTTWTFAVEILDDAVHEGDETFEVELFSATNITLVDDRATITIVDDDPEPTSTPEPLIDV